MRPLFAFLVCAASLCASGELSGRRAPGFSLPDSQYRQHDPQDYRGRVVIIDVMKTDCPHCTALADTLEKVKAAYGDKIAILAIVVPPDNQSTVAAFIKGHGVTYPVLFDCGQVSASYFKATPQHPTVSFPHVFLLDQQGLIRNDFGYDMLTREIFEGRGLFTEIDRMLGGVRKK